MYLSEDDFSTLYEIILDIVNELEKTFSLVGIVISHNSESYSISLNYNNNTYSTSSAYISIIDERNFTISLPEGRYIYHYMKKTDHLSESKTTEIALSEAISSDSILDQRLRLFFFQRPYLIKT